MSVYGIEYGHVNLVYLEKTQTSCSATSAGAEPVRECVKIEVTCSSLCLSGACRFKFSHWRCDLKSADSFNLQQQKGLLGCISLCRPELKSVPCTKRRKFVRMGCSRIGLELHTLSLDPPEADMYPARVIGVMICNRCQLFVQPV